MKKVLDLKMPGVEELGREELREVDGGNLGPWLKKAGWAAIAVWVIENWDDIKAGAVDGWNENH